MVSGSGGAGAQTTDVALGIEALARRDVRGAEIAFTRGTTHASPAIRATALQWRGHVAWKIRGDTGAAMRYLSEGLTVARDSSMLLLELARLHAERRRYHEATRTAYSAFLKSGDGERRGLVARTLVALAARGALGARETSVRDSVDAPVLTHVHDTLLARVKRFPGRTDDAVALITVAVMTNPPSVREGAASFSQIATTAKPRELADHPDSIVTGLVALRMYEAADLAMRFHPPSPVLASRLVPVRAYAAFLQEMHLGEIKFYRATLTGTARFGDLERAYIAAGRKLWNTLYTARGPYTPAALRRELRAQFGTVLSIEETPSELFLGHVFEQYTVAVDGRATPLTVIDGVVANGIDGWLLDGGGGRAGWAARDSIFATRSPFIETSFRAWLGLTDPQTIPGEVFRIARDSSADSARASGDSLGFLPGVAARMFRAGAYQILDSLTPIPPPSDHASRTLWFTRSLYRELFYQSINAHEGRHVRDLRAGKVASGPDAEFRAKIDEVADARFPRLALTAILTPRIGDSTSHGVANLRVMAGLNKWIRGNGARIQGYDPRMPALLQLPLLSDEQLRVAFASMRRP
jgi:hypothetical protein